MIASSRDRAGCKPANSTDEQAQSQTDRISLVGIHAKSRGQT